MGVQLFYLIRHGETDWNRRGLLQGHTDIELNALGERQAQQLGVFMKSLKIQYIVSSDLKRAVRTAEISMPGFTSGLAQDPRLREVYLGEAEGSDRHRMRESYGDKLIDRWMSAKPKDFLAHFPGGESRRAGVDRLKECLSDWLSRHPPTARLAFFTHGLLLRSFTQDIWGRNHENLRAPNCSVFEFSYLDGDFKLRQIFWTDQTESA